MQHGNHSVVILHTERVPLSSSSTERGHVQCVTHPSSVSAAAVAAARLGARSHGCWCCITKGPLIPGTETRPKARPRPAVQPPPRNRWTRRTNQAERRIVEDRRSASWQPAYKDVALPTAAPRPPPAARRFSSSLAFSSRTTATLYVTCTPPATRPSATTTRRNSQPSQHPS